MGPKKDVDAGSDLSQPPKGDEELDDPRKKLVLAKEIGAKYSTKYEIYTFMTVKVGIYLPAHKLVTIYFLKDLMSGRRKRK